MSLLPSATEIVFALGLGDHLDGVTDECDFPPAARRKPVVSTSALPQDRPLTAGEIDGLVAEFVQRGEPIYRLDKELIQRIQPDLILAQDLCRVCAVPSGQVQDALSELGCTAEVISLDPKTIDDVIECVVTVARAIGVDDVGAEIAERLRERVERVRSTALRLPAIRTLALEWGDPPYSGGHWVPGMVEIAGGVNLLSTSGEPSHPIGWHEVADAAPEVIVYMPCGYYLGDAEAEAERLFEQPEFAGTPAARTGAVYAVDASSYFSRPGPRVVDGLEILAWCVHPDAFPQPPADAVTRVSR